MTTEIVRIWHCDAQSCDATAPEDTAGWTDAIYTQGCPAHGDVIAAHRANLRSSTSGRGSRQVTYWYLHCACGWTPRPDWSMHHHAHLRAQHLAHVHALTATEEPS